MQKTTVRTVFVKTRLGTERREGEGRGRGAMVAGVAETKGKA